VPDGLSNGNRLPNVAAWKGECWRLDRDPNLFNDEDPFDDSAGTANELASRAFLVDVESSLLERRSEYFELVLVLFCRANLRHFQIRKNRGDTSY